MGVLVKGTWTADDQVIEQGEFVRQPSVFRSDIDPGIIDAISGEPGRMHLIASASCPWSHRSVIVRAIKRLDSLVPLTIAGGTRVEGYPVNYGNPWQVPGCKLPIIHLHQLYTLSDRAYSGRVSVPVLWDSKAQRIVSNESAKIIRAFDAVARPGPDFELVPDGLRAEIDDLNAVIFRDLSNAVYRAGLAETQSAYDEAESLVFATLDMLEERLTDRRFLFGNLMTESDFWLFPTLIRFDVVYNTHFRCTRKRLVDYPNLWAYARDIFALPGIEETVDFAAIRDGYYLNDGPNNPFGIVAAMPEIDWHEPHGREMFGAIMAASRSGKHFEFNSNATGEQIET